MVVTEYISLSTDGMRDAQDITPQIRNIIYRNNLQNGIVTIFCPGSTCCVTTIEYEPGLVRDIDEHLAAMFPYEKKYYHHDTWHDDNGSSHLQASFIGPSLTVPIVDGEMTLGTWQQIVFIDCDTRKRTRKIVVQCLT